MGAFAAVVAFGLCGHAAPSGAATAESKTVELPAGTVVTLVPNGTGGIAVTHNVGDPIDFTVKNAVILDGWVLIPKGAPAHGTIADLTSAGVHFGGGFSQASLKFKFDWVQLVAGKLKLDDQVVEVKGRQINRKVGGLFGSRDVHMGGYDPFLTAAEYGVDSKTASTVHITSTQKATALEQAQQSDTYINK